MYRTALSRNSRRILFQAPRRARARTKNLSSRQAERIPVPFVGQCRCTGKSKIYRVALTSKEPPHAVDDFYKYVGEHLPEEGETIKVVRFLRGRVIRARVTRVDFAYNPGIAATEVG